MRPLPRRTASPERRLAPRSRANLSRTPLGKSGQRVSNSYLSPRQTRRSCGRKKLRETVTEERKPLCQSASRAVTPPECKEKKKDGGGGIPEYRFFFPSRCSVRESSGARECVCCFIRSRRRFRKLPPPTPWCLPPPFAFFPFFLSSFLPALSRSCLRGGSSGFASGRRFAGLFLLLLPPRLPSLLCPPSDDATGWCVGSPVNNNDDSARTRLFVWENECAARGNLGTPRAEFLLLGLL